MKYPVNDLYPCIQGEGVMTGIPMLLLRLQGCGVGCVFCDTMETWFKEPKLRVDTLEDALGTNPRYVELSASEINYAIRERAEGIEWVLVTGGEPAQYDLHQLVNALHDGGFKVALETSGTENGHIGAGCNWVCISPKLDNPGQKPILPAALWVADEVKMVLGRPQDLARYDAWLKTVILKETVVLCLQPMSLSERATMLCIQTVQKRGWRLSLQTHKFINQR